jgi:hypothetical protein
VDFAGHGDHQMDDRGAEAEELIASCRSVAYKLQRPVILSFIFWP